MAQRDWIGTNWRMAVSVIGILALLSAPARAEPLEALNQQTLELFQNYKFIEANAAAERAASEARTRFGDNHPDYARAIRQHAHTLLMLRRFNDAEPLFKRVFEIFKAKGPADHPDIAEALHDLGSLYSWQKKYIEAEQFFKQALAIREKTFTGDDPGFLETALDLSMSYMGLARREEGERLLLRVIGVVESKLGLDHPYLTPLLVNLSNFRMLSREISIDDPKSKASGAEDLNARSAAIIVKALKNGQLDGSSKLFHPFMTPTLSVLLSQLASEQKLVEADRIASLMRGFRVRKVNAIQAYTMAFGGANLAILLFYETQHKYADYEIIAKESIELLEKQVIFGPDLTIVLLVQYDLLAQFYEKQKKFSQAEIYYKKAIALKETGANPLEAVEALAGGVPIGDTRIPEGLSGFYEKQKRFAEGEEALEHALALIEKHQGGNSPDAADLRQRLAQWRKKHGASRPKSAASEKLAPAVAPAAASAKADGASGCSDFLALVENWDARKAEARKHCTAATWTKLDRSVFLLKSWGASEFASNEYVSLAQEPFEKRDWANAVALLSKGVESAAAARRRYGHQTKISLIGWFDSEVHPVKPPLVLIKAAHRLAAKEPARATELLQKGFVAAQHAHTSAAAVAMAQMVVRQGGGKGSGNAALARLVRERQDLVAEREALDQQLVAAAQQSSQSRDAQADRGRQTRSDAIDARLTDIDKTLAKDFPDYADLASPLPLTVAETQTQMRANEALIFLTDTPQLGILGSDAATPSETFVWVITRTDARWLKADLDSKTLAKEVQALRCGLDGAKWTVGSKQRKECVDVLHKEVGEESLLPFDLGRSHALYRALLGKAGDLIAGKHLLLVPTGPFTSLPLQVLVKEKPGVAIPATPDGYRNVKWLGSEHAITVLPSVSSLKALRARAKASVAARPFIGFGNPLLDGAEGDRSIAELARRKQACPAEAVASAAPQGRPASAHGLAADSLFRGASVDVAALRQAAPLPESADELCAIGRSFGAAASDIWLGARMTETQIKDLSARSQLANYQILHFATHGLVAGEAEQFTKGKAEPSLLFTPPAAASETDDGLLTASEVSQLKLDADWVVLSACNTASGEATEAEALSGLARAFFYAGARALLVSHWSVNSDAAVAVTTGAFSAIQTDPRIGRAEALRRSQRALIAKGGVNAHPSTWAPLILVGEGGQSSADSIGSGAKLP